MSRSYSTFSSMQPFTDGRKKATYTATAPPDHVQHSLKVDAEGRQMPIFRYASGSNGETYVIRTEKIVEHSTVPVSAPVSRFLVTEYRYSSEQPGKEELFRDYGVENRCRRCPEKGEYTQLDSDFDCPEKVEEFITKVMNEAGRGGPTRPVALPMTSSWHSGPNRIVRENPRKYGDERDFREDDRKKLNGSPNWDRHNEPYLNNRGANIQPMISNDRDVYEYFDRPRGKEGPNARNHPLSKPTNDIGSAMEFLEESIKPSYGNGKEFNTSAYTEASRPTMTAPLSKPWRTSSNMSSSDTKTNSKDYDSEQEEEEGRHSCYGKRDELKVMSNQGGALAFQNKDGYEKPKGNIPAAVHLGQTRFPGSTIQKKEKNTCPEKIDSREASRRYGNSITSREAMMRYNDESSITSTEAMRRYNGALLP